jgi:hypothetical protein
LIGRIAAASMDDIDSVNRELESIREVLRNEGERVRQEITGYVRLSQASMAAMTLISESVRQWKDRRPYPLPHANVYLDCRNYCSGEFSGFLSLQRFFRSKHRPNDHGNGVRFETHWVSAALTVTRLRPAALINVGFRMPKQIMTWILCRSSLC